MAALGDSITIAYDIKSLLKADPTYSWSTGTQSAVNSVYTRLEARDTVAPNITRANHAVSGAKIADLAASGRQGGRRDGPGDHPDGRQRCVHVDRGGR